MTSRSARRKFRTIAIAAGAAVTLGVVAVVAVQVGSGSREGTLVSGGNCSNTVARNLSFEPTTGAEGASVYITGANFADVTDITFDGKSVDSFSIISATEITTAVPGGASSGPVAIVSSTAPITSDTCFTTTSPAIASFSPTSGVAGTVVTITGTNFTGATAAKFNGSLVTPTAVTPTSIKVTVPPNAVTGLVSVVTPVSTGVAAGTFSISSAAITEFSPAAGAAGTVVTITGAQLVGATAVRFGTTPAASFRSLSATEVRATVPAGVATGPISISTPAGTATAAADFAAPPAITAFTPITASPGSTVTITGTNFGSVTSVGFAGSAGEATFTVNSATRITATVPDDASTGQLSVRGTDLAVSSTSLAIGPSISSIWPMSGPAGTAVTITGFNLFDLSGVTFNGVPAQFQEVSSTQVTATVPTGSTAGTVAVLTAAGIANSPVIFGPQAAPTLSLEPLGPVSVATSFAGSDSPATSSPADTTPADIPIPTVLSNGQIVLSEQVGASAADADGVLAWSGTAQAQVGTLRIPVSVTYASETSWSVTANEAVATVAIQSVTLFIESINGSITATPSTTVWDLGGRLGAPASIIGDSGATQNGKLALLGGTVSIRPTCPAIANQTSLCAADDTTSVYMALNADGTTAGSGFYANLGTGLPVEPAGAYQSATNLTSGAFVMKGLFAPTTSASIGPNGSISMANMTISVAANETEFAALAGDIIVDSGSANGGFNVVVDGPGHVSVPLIRSFNFSRLSLAYVDGGMVVVGAFGNNVDLGGARMGSFAFFGAQQDTSAKVLGTIVQAPPQTFMFAGSLATPKWLSDNLGVPKSDFGAYATYTTSGLLKITAVIPAALKLPPIPQIDTTVNAFTLTVIVNVEPTVGSEKGFEIAANGTMSIDGNAPIGLVLAARAMSTCAVVVADLCAKESFQATIALSAVGENGTAVWPNIFGVTGLNLNSAAVQIGMTPEIFPYVSIGLAGSGTLPGKLREYMGLDSNAVIPVSFVMNLSAVNPCLSVAVGDPNSPTPILALPPETPVVTAKFMSLLVSPYGCSVGVFDVPAGVQIRAKGTVGEASVDLLGAYNPNPGGPPKLPKTPQFRAWTKVAMPASSRNAQVDLSLRFFAAAGGWNPNPRVNLTGGIKIGGAAQIEIFGSCSIVGCSATGSGDVSILGFNLGMELTVKHLLTPLFMVEASGSLQVAGSQVLMTGSIQPATASFSFSGSGTFPNGAALRRFDIELAQSTNITTGGPPTIRARFRASGSLGGPFKPVSGTNKEFSTGWVNLVPNLSQLNLQHNSNVDLGLITVPVTLGFAVCLKGSCAGTVTTKFRLKSDYEGIPFDIPNIDVRGWNFNAQATRNVNASAQVGSRNAGLKGTFSGEITLVFSSNSGLTYLNNVRVRSQVGAAGWRGAASSGASIDLSGSRMKFCKKVGRRTICVSV